MKKNIKFFICSGVTSDYLLTYNKYLSNVAQKLKTIIYYIYLYVLWSEIIVFGAENGWDRIRLSLYGWLIE